MENTTNSLGWLAGCWLAETEEELSSKYTRSVYLQSRPTTSLNRAIALKNEPCNQCTSHHFFGAWRWAFYVGGMFVMMKWYPESLSSRGWFDFFLSSHQIWHCCVFVAALIWLRGVQATYIWRATHQCEAAASQGWA